MKKTAACLMLASLLAAAGCAKKAGGAEAAPSPSPSPSPSPAPLVADSGDAVTRGDSVFTLNWNPDAGLNPYSCADADNLLLCGLVYETLFAVNRDYTFRPVLVSEWSCDGEAMSFDFAIKAGVSFHDGSELTVWDALYSLNTARSSARYKSRLRAVSEAWVEGGRLHVRLSRPDADFPALLDIPVIKDGSAGASTPPGTGPYLPGEYAGAVFLKAFERHRDCESLPFRRIYLSQYPPEELVAAYEEELIDLVVSDFYEPGSPEFKGSGEVRKLDTTVMHYIGVNAERPFLADAGRRKLVSTAIGREALASEIIGGQAALLPVSPASRYYYEDIAASSVYPDLSGALVKNLTEDYDGDGLLEYLDGTPRDFTLVFIACTEDPANLMAARRAAADLRAAGFDVKLRELDRRAFGDALYLGDFDLYYGTIRLKADFDLGELLSYGGSASWGLADLALTPLISRFMAASGDGKTEAAREIYAYIADTCPIIPLAFEQQLLLTHRGAVTGLNPTWQNVFDGIAGWKAAF